MSKLRIKHSQGYWLLRRPDHPYCSKGGYVPEARLVMEESIGRYINPLIETVHHKDINKQNNNIDNLMLLAAADHRKIHCGWEFIDGDWWKTCNVCGRFLKIEGNFYRRTNGRSERVSHCIKCSSVINAKNYPHKLSHEERSSIQRVAALKGWKTKRQGGG